MSSNNLKRASESLLSLSYYLCKNVSFNGFKLFYNTGISSPFVRKYFLNRFNYVNVNSKVFETSLKTIPIIRNTSYNSSRNARKNKIIFPAMAGIFSYFQTKEDEEESEIITTIKRAIIMIQHDDYKGAEQMLHVALRLAQQTQNRDGITYIYDLLANVAFSQGEFTKAEGLFKEVMQRALSQGMAKDDIKIIHMSLKLAKIYENLHDWEKSEEGYKFCMTHLDKMIKTSEDDDEVVMLWGMTLDWYARFLHQQNRLEEAFNNYKQAYDICVRLNGEVAEQSVILLNDLGTISFLKGDNENAIYYMTKAVEMGRHLPNMQDFSSVYVNLGTIYLQKEMFKEAEKNCQEGLKNAKRHKNEEGFKEANICLDMLKEQRNNKSL